MSSDYRRRMLDEAIDRAVRDMVQIDPAPGLRRRVLSRLERRSSASWLLAHRGSWIPLEAAAVLMIVFTLLYPRLRTDRPHDTPDVPSVTRSAPSAPPITRSAPSAPSAPSDTPPARSATRSAPTSIAVFGPRRDHVGAATVTTIPPAGVSTSQPEESIASISPIVMVPLTPVSEIRIPPIEIPRITVPALSPRQ